MITYRFEVYRNGTLDRIASIQVVATSFVVALDLVDVAMVEEFAGTAHAVRRNIPQEQAA